MVEQTITSLDLYPTFVDIAGATLPEDHLVRGRSFLPLLEGDEVEDWDNDFFGEYSMINYSDAYMRCYRTPEWKLVRDFLNPERDELYHLALDPEENINLIGCHSLEVEKVLTHLESKMEEQMEKIHDPLLKMEHVDKEAYRHLYMYDNGK
jgi:uncharacterized sulfatase